MSRLVDYGSDDEDGEAVAGQAPAPQSEIRQQSSRPAAEDLRGQWLTHVVLPGPTTFFFFSRWTFRIRQPGSHLALLGVHSLCHAVEDEDEALQQLASDLRDVLQPLLGPGKDEFHLLVEPEFPPLLNGYRPCSGPTQIEP